MPTHIPASLGRGALPPSGGNQQWQSIQIETSYYQPTYTADKLISINLYNWKIVTTIL